MFTSGFSIHLQQPTGKSHGQYRISFSHEPITFIEKSADGERAFDIYSRLLNERIIFLGEEVNEHTANSVVAQLLHLAYVDPEADI